MTIPALNAFNKIYPLIIEKYETFIPNVEDEDITVKINSIITHLNSVGKLSNDVVVQWNKVMKWILENGLDESVTKKLDEMVASGAIREIIDTALAEMSTEVDTRLDGFESSLAEKANQTVTVDVRDYDFVGDGVTNDTPNIQAAINYCESIGGGTVIFPPNKTVKISKTGNRSIWAWSTTSTKNRAYALLIPSNVEIDFNGCKLVADRVDTETINIIENKNASVDLPQDTNIKIKNVILDQGAGIDTFAGNTLDSVTLCLQNINGLVLDNVTVLNSYMAGIRIIKSSNIQFRNKIEIDKCIGCNIRLGWGTSFPVDDVSINLLIARDSSDRLTSNTPGNTLYTNGVTNAYIKEYRQYSSDITKYNDMGVNIANNSKHIHFGKVYSNGVPFKIQDYSNNGTDQPENITIDDMVMIFTGEKSRFYIQGNMTKINNLYCEDISPSGNGGFWINNGLNTEIGTAYFKDLTFAIKTSVTGGSAVNKIVKFGKLTLHNSQIISSYSANDELTINELFVKWDKTTTTGSTYKILDVQLPRFYVEKLTYKLDGSMLDGTQLYNMASCTSSSEHFKIGKITDLNAVKKEAVTITLSAGTNTVVMLTTNNIFRESWTNALDIELIPLDLTSNIVIYNSFVSHVNNDRVRINHSTAAGTEQFRMSVKGYKRIKTT